MIKAESIDEVISYLDHIINWSKERHSRVGYFASLYKRMTVSVKNGIANGLFENPARMELLDVIFANRYLQAWEAYHNKKNCSSAWAMAFDACTNSRLIVLQHLLLGINTHINLDLGIAAAETASGKNIFDLKADFEKINDIIAELNDVVQEDLIQVFPPLKFLIGIARHRREQVLEFSINSARKASWANAVALSVANTGDRDNYISKMDKTVVLLANRICNPGFAMQFALRPIRALENQKTVEIVEMLND